MTLPHRADIDADDEPDIESWIVPVRRALVARYGIEVGAEAAAEAATWAVEHAERLAMMGNPAGYLYRVGQTAARRSVRWGSRHVMFPSEPVAPDLPLLDVDLFRALEQLREEHRICRVAKGDSDQRHQVLERRSVSPKRRYRPSVSHFWACRAKGERGAPISAVCLTVGLPGFRCRTGRRRTRRGRRGADRRWSHQRRPA